MNRKFEKFAMAGLAVLALAAVPATRAAELRIGLTSEPNALDPTTSGDLAARQVLSSICDKLIDIDDKLQFVPQLATRWSWSADAKTLNLELRPGVTFHDGEPFNADAVVYSINRHLTLPGSTRKSEISSITSVEKTGDLKVALKLSSPQASLLSALSDRAGMMVSPKAAKAAGSAFGSQPVCAGPYRFVERVAQERIVLEKYPKYWDAAAYPVDSVRYVTLPDATVRLSNLRAGQIDVMERVAASDMKTIQGDPKLQLATSSGLSSYYIVTNIAGGSGAKGPISTDKRVREALELAIDRNALNQVAFEGTVEVGNQPVPPSSPWYIKEFPVPARDVKRARALIREATGKDRVAFKMLVPNVSPYQRYAEVLQAMAAEAGIDITLEVQEVTTLLANWASGSFETLTIRWSGRVDPDGNISGFKTCGGSRNGGKYCNPKLDEWVEKARTTSDPKLRYDAYRNAAEIYLAERPYLYLFHGKEVTGLRKTVTGFVQSPDGILRLRNVSLGK